MMPASLIFHEGHAAALGRVLMMTVGFPFVFSQVDGSVDGIHVVARDGQDVPAKVKPIVLRRCPGP